MNIKTEDFYNDIANDVEKGLTLQITSVIDHYLQERTKK